MLDDEFEGKVVLITGGAGGIGSASAARFSELGAAVAVADVDGAAANEVADRLVDLGFAITADVSDAADCERMVREAVGRTGRLDVLLNAAGVWTGGPTVEATEEQWDRTVGVNLKGMFFACRYAIPELERSKGCIVNVSSDAGILGNAENAIYNASKGGVNLLTRSLALELAPKGVRVNAVCPTDVDTPLLADQARERGGDDPQDYLERLRANYPQGERARFVRPDEVAELVVFLASDRAEPITGSCVTIDFGVTAGF